jgi:glutathione S-transferase
MHLLLNTTSPYARLARIALAEKGITDVSTDVVDPWADPPRLREFNAASRVPTLVAEERWPLTESLLIVMWLERERPAPSLLGPAALAVVSRAGIAMGAIDAAVHTLIGRKTAGASFDTDPVGLRRRRTMVESLQRLDGDPPPYAGDTPSLDAIAAIVALDYIDFRFPQASWLPDLPALRALQARLSERASFAASRPRN